MVEWYHPASRIRKEQELIGPTQHIQSSKPQLFLSNTLEMKARNFWVSNKAEQPGLGGDREYPFSWNGFGNPSRLSQKFANLDLDKYGTLLSKYEPNKILEQSGYHTRRQNQTRCLETHNPKYFSPSTRFLCLTAMAASPVASGCSATLVEGAWPNQLLLKL